MMTVCLLVCVHALFDAAATAGATCVIISQIYNNKFASWAIFVNYADMYVLSMLHSRFFAIVIIQFDVVRPFYASACVSHFFVVFSHPVAFIYYIQQHKLILFFA